MSALLALLPLEWPSFGLELESWVLAEKEFPRWSEATLELGGPPAWLASVPSHLAAGGQLSGKLYGALEAGFLQGPDALGIRAWDMASTGFLPSQEISAGLTRGFFGLKLLEDPKFSVDFGVDKRWFGELLSRGLPLSGLRLTADWGGFAFQYQILGLSDYVADSERWFKEGRLELGEALRRFLTVRRVEWAPAAWLTLSFTEASVYATRRALPRLGYLNPLMSAYVWQWNAADDNNALWDFDAAWRMRPGLALFVEFLIDDAQFNPDYWDDAPPDFAVSVRAVWLPGSWGFSLGFAGASTWCYNNTRPWDKYEAWGEPIGPRPDWQLVELRLWRRGAWRPGLGLSLESKGVVEVSTPDPGLGNYPSDFWLLDPETRAVPSVWLERISNCLEARLEVDATPRLRLWLVLRR